MEPHADSFIFAPRCPAAFVDFTHPDPLHLLAAKLSQALFAGIGFAGEGEGIWDEVPAMRLERDYLGFRRDAVAGTDFPVLLQLMEVLAGRFGGENVRLVAYIA
jgi:hypothetical protein